MNFKNIMAFLNYKKVDTGSTIRYEQLNSLKLGGPDGLIAKHVRTLAGDDVRSWKLETAALLKLAGRDTADTTVLFAVTGRDSTSVCLYELRKIHGSCRDTSTQLALDFAIIVDQEIGGDASAYCKSFEIRAPDRPRLLREILSLTGGPDGGEWRWGTPTMQLGATVVHAQSGQLLGGVGKGSRHIG